MVNMQPVSPPPSHTTEGVTNPFETREYEASQESRPSTTETSSADSQVRFCSKLTKNFTSLPLLIILKNPALPHMPDAVVPPLTLRDPRRSPVQPLSSAGLEIVSNPSLQSLESFND